MMFSTNYSLVKLLMEMKVQEALREAEGRRLRQQAGLSRTAGLSRCAGSLLAELGNLLVALGRRLQRHRAPESLSLGS